MRTIRLLPVALVAPACAKEPAPAGAPAEAAPQQVTITATDFGYQLPAGPIHAGLTTVTLVNSGQEIFLKSFRSRQRVTIGKDPLIGCNQNNRRLYTFRCDGVIQVGGNFMFSQCQGARNR